MYEDLGLISKPLRKENGYRLFNNISIDQFKLAQTALKIEVIQNGLRKKLLQQLKYRALGKYDEAIVLTDEYIASIETEIKNANEAVTTTAEIIHGINKETNIF